MRTPPHGTPTLAALLLPLASAQFCGAGCSHSSCYPSCTAASHGGVGNTLGAATISSLLRVAGHAAAGGGVSFAVERRSSSGAWITLPDAQLQNYSAGCRVQIACGDAPCAAIAASASACATGTSASLSARLVTGWAPQTYTVEVHIRVELNQLALCVAEAHPTLGTYEHTHGDGASDPCAIGVEAVLQLSVVVGAPPSPPAMPPSPPTPPAPPAVPPLPPGADLRTTVTFGATIRDASFSEARYASGLALLLTRPAGRRLGGAADAAADAAAGAAADAAAGSVRAASGRRLAPIVASDISLEVTRLLFPAGSLHVVATITSLDGGVAFAAIRTLAALTPLALSTAIGGADVLALAPPTSSAALVFASPQPPSAPPLQPLPPPRPPPWYLAPMPAAAPCAALAEDGAGRRLAHPDDVAAGLCAEIARRAAARVAKGGDSALAPALLGGGGGALLALLALWFCGPWSQRQRATLRERHVVPRPPVEARDDSPLGVVTLTEAQMC